MLRKNKQRKKRKGPHEIEGIPLSFFVFDVGKKFLMTKNPQNM